MALNAKILPINNGKANTMMAKTQTASTWNELLVKLGEERDRPSFKQLFRHFAPLIKSYFIAKLPSQHSDTMVDELVQEVMFKVWQKANTYDPAKAAASTWIFTLARNTHIDMLRRYSKFSTTTSIETEAAWEDTTDNGPLTHLQHHRNQQTIKQSLEQLPSEQALVIQKVYIESKSHSEVANELGLPLGTVKSRVRLALNKLKILISE